MSLDINKFNDEFTLFLETQTAACRTARVLGDCYHWEKIAAPLMTIGNQYGAGWEPSGRMLLENGAVSRDLLLRGCLLLWQPIWSVLVMILS